MANKGVFIDFEMTGAQPAMYRLNVPLPDSVVTKQLVFILRKICTLNRKMLKYLTNEYPLTISRDKP